VFSQRFDPTLTVTVRAEYYPSAGHGNSWFENWLIPASATPVKISVVRWPVFVGAGKSAVTWGQLLGMGITWGQLLTMGGGSQ
jgi:hypothetical protein